MDCKIFDFGLSKNNEIILAARLSNDNGMTATIISYGAALQSLVVPDRNGVPVDVVLGYDTIEEYESNDGNMGATIGRFANRIRNGKFELNGRKYQLAINDTPNHLHGGNKGFDKCVWDISCDKANDSVSATLSRLSEDGEEGYPGNIKVSVNYVLDNTNTLSLVYSAETDQDTIVNMTNHSYFNLNGRGDVLGHIMKVNSNKILENDKHCLPTGKVIDVGGTVFDFRKAKAIGTDLGSDDELLTACGGYDHDFLLDNKGKMSLAAVLIGDNSGIEMSVITDRPGMQIYTANFLSKRKAKGDLMIDKRYAVCLETMGLSDSINHREWPQSILRIGEKYSTTTQFSFKTF